MKKIISFVGLVILMVRAAFGADPALTIYNQNFAVVRDTVPLALKSGVNEVRFADATAHVEPDSVILRDPAGKRVLQILEQNYRADPISQELLLSLFEGKTIGFENVSNADGQQKREIIQGKIIRSGYVPHYQAMQRYDSQYYQGQMARASGGAGQPIVEVNGKLRFGLPGQPIFPSLGDDTILKPTLTWVLQADKAAKLNAELSYVSGGMNWNAAYNLVLPEKGDTLDLVGWVTIDNQSGKSFNNAKIKLMAGDVNKIQPQNDYYAMDRSSSRAGSGGAGTPPVSEKSFDEYHLYTLERATTLLDRETKQVEFVHATGIKSALIYVYDGAQIDLNRYRGWGYDSIRQDRDYGTQSNPKVWVMREFMNSEANHLGMPLPKGRLRFYRRDIGGQLEFTGEDTIDHTPRDENIRASTGNAFDLKGERKRKDYKMDSNQRWLDETFEIKLRNHKKEPVEIRVVEHLYRWNNWEIEQKSDNFLKTDAQTVEFLVQVKPDEEKTVSYTVHYSW
ncbi:MAG: DUF4139 domain-containing protein [Verrucomicrobiota bacterium]|nr:DUF4139 domain-containing protein [Verrucomicrobiota bacterium]